MKLKIENKREVLRIKASLDGINVGEICRCMSVNFSAGEIPEVTMDLIPNVIDIESDVDMFVVIGEKRYRLVEQ